MASRAKLPKEVGRSGRKAGANVKVKVKKVKPIDLQSIFDESVAAESSESVVRTVLQSIVDRGAHILFQHHVQKQAMEMTAAQTVENILDALQIRVLKHDAGEPTSIFPSPDDVGTGECIEVIPLQPVAEAIARAGDDDGSEAVPLAPGAAHQRYRDLLVMWGDTEGLAEAEADAKAAAAQAAAELAEGSAVDSDGDVDADAEAGEEKDVAYARSRAGAPGQWALPARVPWGQLWAAEAPPPPCVEDRWSRSMIPVQVRGSTDPKHHLALDGKYVESIKKTQVIPSAPSSSSSSASVAAAGAGAGAGGSLPVGLGGSRSLAPSASGASLTSPTAAAAAAAGAAGGSAHRGSLSAMASGRRGSSMMGAGAGMSGGVAGSGSGSGPTPAALLAAHRENAMKGDTIDLRAIPHDSVLFLQDASAIPVGLGRRASLSAAATASAAAAFATPQTTSALLAVSKAQQQQLAQGGLSAATSGGSGSGAGAGAGTGAGGAGGAAAPFPVPVEPTAHRLLEESLRTVELRNLQRARQQEAQASESLARLASEASRVEKQREELKGRDFTFTQTGKVVLVRPVASESLVDGITAPAFRLVGGTGAAGSAAAGAAGRGRGAAGAGGAGGAGGKGAAGSGPSGADLQAAAALQAARAAIAAFASGAGALAVDTSSVQPPIAQALQPASSVTLKQGAVVKAGPKKAADRSAGAGAGGAATSSPYAGMTKEQYVQSIQGRAAAAAGHSGLTVPTASKEHVALPKDHPAVVSASAVAMAAKAKAEAKEKAEAERALHREQQERGRAAIGVHKQPGVPVPQREVRPGAPAGVRAGAGSTASGYPDIPADAYASSGFDAIVGATGMKEGTIVEYLPTSTLPKRAGVAGLHATGTGRMTMTQAMASGALGQKLQQQAQHGGADAGSMSSSTSSSSQSPRRTMRERLMDLQQEEGRGLVAFGKEATVRRHRERLPPGAAAVAPRSGLNATGQGLEDALRELHAQQALAGAGKKQPVAPAFAMKLVGSGKTASWKPSALAQAGANLLNGTAGGGAGYDLSDPFRRDSTPHIESTELAKYFFAKQKAAAGGAGGSAAHVVKGGVGQ